MVDPKFETLYTGTSRRRTGSVGAIAVSIAVLAHKVYPPVVFPRHLKELSDCFALNFVLTVKLNFIPLRLWCTDFTGLFSYLAVLL